MAQWVAAPRALDGDPACTISFEVGPVLKLTSPTGHEGRSTASPDRPLIRTTSLCVFGEGFDETITLWIVSLTYLQIHGNLWVERARHNPFNSPMQLVTESLTVYEVSTSSYAGCTTGIRWISSHICVSTLWHFLVSTEKNVSTVSCLWHYCAQ